jgi:hypothetical protein
MTSVFPVMPHRRTDDDELRPLALASVPATRGVSKMAAAQREDFGMDIETLACAW